uniref:DegT/DnrJ/EryC1/StrS family aminotransferase n=1 Tax=Schlesneria paludicola TaxID=360056 RepID=A0A7C2NXK4_9PLAN
MIPAFDARQEYLRLKPEIDAAIERVLLSGRLILGPEVEAFEREFAQYVGARHGVGVKTGTDALMIALKALDIGAGDEVITVANTAVPTVAAIRAVGAVPRFVDIDPHTLLMDPARVEPLINRRTRCLMPVHLYGNPVDMPSLMSLARKHGLPVVGDCAQAHGAVLGDRHVGTFSDIGCFSFYPTKNLGAFGDGGLCVTNDERLARRMRSIRMYGFEDDRIAHCDGVCSRLDEMQAAILRVKLRHLDGSLQARRRLATLYSRGLSESGYQLPVERTGTLHAFHLYVVRAEWRQSVTRSLREADVEFGIHYPVPIHLMPAYEPLGYRRGDLPETERAAREVLSLPLHLGLSDSHVERVADLLYDAATLRA